MSEAFSLSGLTIHRYSELPEDEPVGIHRHFFPAGNAMNEAAGIRWHYGIGSMPGVEPLYAKYEGRVIGQAGLQPVTLLLNGNPIPAIWYIDFFILDEFQRKGIGQELTKRWMALCPNHITQCNDKSIGVFKKMGWQEHFKTIRFALPLNVANLARQKGMGGMKKMAAIMAQPLLRIVLLSRTIGAAKVTIIPLGQCRAADLLPMFQEADTLKVKRDAAWVQWRLFDSPFIDQYALARTEGAALIYRFFENKGLKRMHILYVQRNGDAVAQKRLLKAVVRQALHLNADLIWAVANTADLMPVLKQVLPSALPTRFAYNSADVAIKEAFAKQVLPMQAIDSDNDMQYF